MVSNSVGKLGIFPSRFEESKEAEEFNQENSQQFSSTQEPGPGNPLEYSQSLRNTKEDSARNIITESSDQGVMLQANDIQRTVPDRKEQ